MDGARGAEGFSYRLRKNAPRHRHLSLVVLPFGQDQVDVKSFKVIVATTPPPRPLFRSGSSTANVATTPPPRPPSWSGSETQERSTAYGNRHLALVVPHGHAAAVWASCTSMLGGRTLV